MSEAAPKRRWFRFSLRTLFMVAAVVACGAYFYTLLPNELTWTELKSLKPGMTELEVIELVGRPDAMEPDREGRSFWYYGSFFPDSVEFKDGRVVNAVRF